MNLIDDAGRIARKAWSMRFIYASVGLGALDTALPYFAPEHPSRLFGTLSMLTAAAAGLSRLVAQPKLKR